jgi:hypothetical protein
MEETATVNKGGETCIQVTLARNGEGLRVSAKVHPRVEEFMRILNNGNVQDIRTYSRLWTPPSGSELTAYTGGKVTGGSFVLEDGSQYTLDQLGQPMHVPNGTPAPTLNLSFLRLVGISVNDGVSFTIKGVFSTDAMKRMKEQMSLATRKFYVDFVRPVNMTITVSTQEVRY